MYKEFIALRHTVSIATPTLDYHAINYYHSLLILHNFSWPKATTFVKVTKSLFANRDNCRFY